MKIKRYILCQDSMKYPCLLSTEINEDFPLEKDVTSEPFEGDFLTGEDLDLDEWLEEEGKEEIEVILLKKSDYLELINKDKKNV